MLFTEFRFFIFFIGAFIVYWSLNKNQHRLVWLLICSYIFYGAWDWRFLSLIVISTLIDYWVGVKLFKTRNKFRKKAWLCLSLASNLGILGFFKYFNFFADSALSFFGYLGIPANYNTFNIILPVGISFYTFQTLSYSIDIYFGKLKPVRSILKFSVFVSFFPQLVAGPIVRASTFLPQLETKRKFQQVNIRLCLMLFLIGFIKKACISDRISPFIDQFFTAPDTYTVSSAWIAVLLYAVQIYCDFSGYTDMAIATAGLLGYELCLNFDFPYFADNIAAFWRRWHISLSTWLKDYLYIPLGGSRGGKLMTYRNLMITMVLGGLWHGAGWNFIIWGALHGTALIGYREWSSRIKPFQSLKPILSLAGTVLTFYWVCLAWIFFRAVTLKDALITVKAFLLFDASGSQQLSLYLFGVIVALAVCHYLAYRRYWSSWWRKIPDWLFAAWYGLAVSIVLLFIAPAYSAFIYFQF
jgi:alginate O-acetyltransferase complex protein AlgI